jgi:hypothetical protein
LGFLELHPLCLSLQFAKVEHSVDDEDLEP